MDPLVSIITPCYNSEQFIAETIKSVINQVYKNWELIIVDDKSTDNSKQLIAEIANQNPKIRLISLAENAGVSNARNIGVKAAQGKYVAFLDSDDTWQVDKLSRQVDFMESNQYVVSFLSYHRINEQSKIISAKINMPSSVSYSQLLWHNIIIFSTSMVLRSVAQHVEFKKVGHEDWVYWLDIFKQGYQGKGLNESLVLYRIRSGSVSSNKISAVQYTWKIYRESEKLGLLYSMYLFTRYAFATVWKRLK